MGVCSSCHQEKNLFARGMCNTCWKAARPKIRCGCCGLEKPSYSTKFGVSLCQRCSDGNFSPPEKACTVCGRDDQWMNGRDVCIVCVGARTKGKRIRRCSQCGRMREIRAYGLCPNCYNNNPRFLRSQLASLTSQLRTPEAQ